jgi:hypothetical protein
MRFKNICNYRIKIQTFHYEKLCLQKPCYRTIRALKQLIYNYVTTSHGNMDLKNKITLRIHGCIIDVY